MTIYNTVTVAELIRRDLITEWNRIQDTDPTAVKSRLEQRGFIITENIDA